MLVPLYLDAAGALHAVFTERRADLSHHAGEISFPGGRRDEQDPDLWATALRECHEEIGLPRDAVELVREVAAAGEVMPPKSTYFFPKVPTGLLFNPLS